ncbi:MAG: DEAD/DEAH box helicase [Candidatus ainarchaeum sp.]|nr:DEAD/DEAH box helicase [Candidatus ainarchaeum sp.]
MADVAQLVRERFGELTEIQKLAIPRVLAGENVLILAPTGFGKTETALLPVLEKIKTKPAEGGGIRALYITPLRALSRDLKGRFGWWCERLGISHDIRTGDTTLAERAKHRKKPPQILLTTVESLQALLLGRVMRQHLTSVEFVIVDEIHDILDNKRGAQLSMGLERLANIAKFQRIGISATVANEDEAAKLLFGERPFAVCEAGKNRKMDTSVDFTPSHEERQKKMKALIEESRSLLFVNTRSTAEELGASLKKMGAPIEVHHGSLSKEIRLSTEDRFKRGEIKSILATSSLELGIDIGDVSLVVQYGSPHQAFRLIQRVGRSGHSLEKTPRGVIFATDFDDMLESEVVRVLASNGWMEDKRVERGALDVIAHQLTGLCLDFGPMKLSQAHETLSRSYAYGIGYDKLRMVALQLYGEGILNYEESGKDVFVRIRPRARIYYSSFLSTIPKTKRFSMRDISANKPVSSLDEEFVVNLEPGTSFFSRGLPWRVVDITEDEVLAEPSSASDIAVPSWTGEDIPVSFEVAQDVGRMRAVKKEISPMPDDKTIVMEIIEDLIIVHACFGSRVNSGLSRIFGQNLSRAVGESVRAVSDPYRIMVRLPYPLKEDAIRRAFMEIRDVKAQLSESLTNSSLLKFKFLHVGRMFGLLSEEATINSRFIDALRNSVVYEEAMRSIFFRYFDIPRTNEVLAKLRKGGLKLVVDARKHPSYFAKIGIDRVSGGEYAGAFEPRERIIAAFRENALSKTLRLVCLHCKATRYLHLAGAPEIIKCHKCGEKALALLNREGEAKSDLDFSAGLIRAYGRKALIALSTYGVGPKTADRVLKRLHKTDDAFYLDLLEAQKLFIKNKRFWKP